MSNGRYQPVEWRELIGLMMDARYVRPAPVLERRLRELLSVEDRSAPEMAWDDLVQFGLIVLGTHFIEKAFAEA